MAKGMVHLNNANFTAIKHIHAETGEPKQQIANRLIAFSLSIVNQAREQGTKDENIADFLEYFMENAKTDTHISLMVQNYQECLEAGGR